MNIIIIYVSFFSLLIGTSSVFIFKNPTKSALIGLISIDLFIFSVCSALKTDKNLDHWVVMLVGTALMTLILFRAGKKLEECFNAITSEVKIK